MNVFVINDNEYSLRDPSFIELLTEEINSASEVKLVVIYGYDDAYVSAREIFNKYNILYLGYSPLNEDDLFACLTFFSLSNDLEFPNGYYVPDSELKYFNRQFDDRLINSYLAKEPDYSLFSSSANYILSVIDKLKFTLNAESINLIKNQIYFDLFMLDLVGYRIAKCEYPDMHKGLFRAANNKTITEHIFRIAADNEKLGGSWGLFFAGISFYKRLVLSGSFDFLIFYFYFFRFLAISYKRWWKSPICYSFLLRAFEVIITYYGLRSGAIIEYNGDLFFSTTNDKISGVGQLAHYAKDIELIEETSDIFKLISIRNNSFLGHGFYKPSLGFFDDALVEVNKLFKSKFLDRLLDSQSSSAFDSMFVLTTKAESLSRIRSLWICSHVI